MDQYQRAFIEARKEASRIVLLKNNRFLDLEFSDLILPQDQWYVPSIGTWHQVDGYRTKDTLEKTLEMLEEAASTVLSSAHGSCSAYVLEKKEAELRVYYGTSGTVDLPGILRASLCEPVCHAASWNPEQYGCCGIITGSLSASKLADVFARLQMQQAYAACISFGTSGSEVWEKMQENENSIRFLEPYASVQRVYGTSSRRVETIPVQEVSQALSVLKTENEFLNTHSADGFVRSCIRFGAASQQDCRKLASALKSALAAVSSEAASLEPVRLRMLPGSFSGWRSCLSIPRMQIVQTAFQGLADLISWQSLPCMASLYRLPSVSVPGFYASGSALQADTLELFSVIQPPEGTSIQPGTVLESGKPARIPLESVKGHVFAAGSTRTGKTTTVKRILKSLYDQGISCLVLEAAKKEYMWLHTEIEGLRILTPGQDGTALKINPLQPEEGILIENHTDAVVRALCASMGGEHPIPEALQGLIRKTYEKAGWPFGLQAWNDRRRPFPTFEDVLKNIPDYVHHHARYGPEVRQNLEGALRMRCETLHSGVLGQITNQPFGMQAKDLLNVPTVIELADFAPSGIEFLMNLLLFNLHGWLSRQPESSQLRRVIVVEEAHNVFHQTLSEESGRARINEQFERMLAEISASGTGMILCDQRPSIMSDAVMANTAVKIVHGLNGSQDRRLMAESMSLSPAQMERIREFKTGECLISLQGIHGVQHMKTAELVPANPYSPSCLLCTSRFRCRKQSVSNLLQTIDPHQAAWYISRITASPWNAPVVSENISLMLHRLNISATPMTKICLLGVLLRQHGKISVQIQREIISTYANYLKGKPNE